jgi:hypothetical protein
MVFTNPKHSNNTLESRKYISKIETIVTAKDFAEAIDKINLLIEKNSELKHSTILYSECSEILELSDRYYQNLLNSSEEDYTNGI